MNNIYFETKLKNPTDNDVLNEYINSLGRYSNFKKETFFTIYIANENYETCVSKLTDLKQSGFLFLNQIKTQITNETNIKYNSIINKDEIIPNFKFLNHIWQDVFLNSIKTVINLFKETIPSCTNQDIQAFTIKILFLIDNHFGKLFTQTEKLSSFPKFACSGKINTEEYLFLYLLYLLGCDVLYITKENNINISSNLLSLSIFREYKKQKPHTQNIMPKPVKISKTTNSEHKKSPKISLDYIKKNTKDKFFDKNSNNRELSYEELAKFSSSVVMINILDENKKSVGIGSGVLINSKGYLITNFHVVSSGVCYNIQFEEQEETFFTDTIIKYNQNFDLAILKINDITKKPISILSKSQKLSRGQKIVAIGSPLGLFNTISDGIISGFRKNENSSCSFIQFTAPSSPGSSGGALMDLYGNLVGIMAGGFNAGQNLNIAIDYTTIHDFAHNFIEY